MALQTDEARFRKLLSRNVTLPLLLTALLAGTFIVLLIYLRNESRQVDRADQVLSEINLVTKFIIDAETGLRGDLMTGEALFLQPYHEGTLAIPNEFEKLRQLRREAPPEEIAKINAIEDRYKKWHDYAEARIAERLNEPRTLSPEQVKLRNVQVENGKAIMDDIRHNIVLYATTQEEIRAKEVEDTNSALRNSFAVTLILTFGLGSLLAFLGRRQLIVLASSYEDALAKQVAQTQALERRAWINRGRGELNEKILGDLALNSVSENALNFVARYLGAKVGAFYVTNTYRHLERSAVFAFPVDSPRAPRELNFGEGLVGQVALERKVMTLENIPDNYLLVSSGLGQIAARYVVIYPLLTEDSVKGVLELGFTHPIEAEKLELLKDVSEQIAVAIRAAQYRAQLEGLLKDSQQLSEELQQQQEELRVSNEELEENSRVLKETQLRLESQHSELEQTNEQLEEQTRSLEEKNDQLNFTQITLAQKAQELQAASLYKSEFLANMSHELRTPLNSSLILAKLLAENPRGNLTAEQVEFANTIYTSGNDLLSLINDILDLSKVEAGKLQITPEKFSSDKLLEGLERVFKPLADQKKLEFTTVRSADAPDYLFTDRQRLEQILKNFLSNAIKFTSSGKVTLEARRASEGITLTVTDTGIGIPEDQQEQIFEAFRQADGTTSRKYGGTGLGLTISRDLARLLGGTIRVTSEVGKGSQFHVTLPENYVPLENPVFTHEGLSQFTQANQATPRQKPAPRDDRENTTPAAKKLLIVEDDRDFAKVLIDLSHELNFSAIHAETADAAYDLAITERPDAVILDMKLPDHSGLSVLDRLKKNSKTRHIPVHVFSVDDHSQAVMNMGAIGYGMKPVALEDLRKAFTKIQEKMNQELKRVLIVEDDHTQLQSMCKLIGGPGTQAIPASSGKEAIERLTTESIDCMILDLSLPDMTGFELLERITERGTACPPIIVYTGRSLTRDEEDRLRKYSRSVIIKGARSPERLLDEVSLFIHQVESKLPPERQQMLLEARNREKIVEGRKILIVDDDVRNIFALTSALELKGATVEVARNGQESIDKLNEDAEIELILMDIMMPVMDGYTAIKEIRSNDKFAKIPIIAITAKAMRDDQERSLLAGANDYLAKPIEMDKLMSLIRVWMPKSEWI